MLTEYIKLTLLAVMVILIGTVVGSQIFYYGHVEGKMFVRVNRITATWQICKVTDQEAGCVTEGY